LNAYAQKAVCFVMPGMAVARHGLLPWICVMLVFAAGVARGHDPFEVTTEARLRSDSLEIAVTMSRSTAMAVCGDEKSQGELFDPEKFESVRPLLMAGAPKLYEISDGGNALTPRRVTVGLGQENDVEFHLVYPRPGGGTLRFDALHIKRLPPEGYGAALTVVGDAGKLLGTKLLTAEDSVLEIALPSRVASPVPQPSQPSRPSPSPASPNAPPF
jgi:hypothetical protein